MQASNQTVNIEQGNSFTEINLASDRNYVIFTKGLIFVQELMYSTSKIVCFL